MRFETERQIIQTLTHEAGHWVGLYHTFEDWKGGRGSGCVAPGDYVNDTPPEAFAAFECVERDTCPGGGPDPIRKPLSFVENIHRIPLTMFSDNFMDYTPDACMNNFTPGQGNRLGTQLATYRSL